MSVDFTPCNAKPSLRVVFAGTPEFAAVSLQALLAAQAALNIQIVAVYTQPDRKAGRGQKLAASAVKQVALAHDVAIEQPTTFKKSTLEGQAARARLASYRPDVMVVAAYGLILPLGVLTTPTYGCLNIHASLLPRWRGAAPIHRALLAGDDKTGITIMQMAAGLDTGDMLYRVARGITPKDTAQSLHDDLAQLGAEAILTVLADLPSYQAQAIPQDDAQANYAEKLSKAEGQIDWQQTATVIERQIRGLNPWPGSFGFVATGTQAGKRMKVLASLLVNASQLTTEQAGTVISVGRNAILVACGGGTTLRLTKLQFEGGTPLSAEQVCQGNQLNDGDRLQLIQTGTE